MAIAAPESTDLQTGTRMTLAEFVHLPQELRDRAELRNGVVRLFSDDEVEAMTIRNPNHTECLSLVIFFLMHWAREQADAFRVYSGEVGVQLPEAESYFGIDAAVFAAGDAHQSPDDQRVLVGVPRLAVEILSPSDMFQDVNEKVHAYMTGGVPLVWVLDPFDNVVAVYRDGGRIATASGDDLLSGYDVLSGLEVSANELFPKRDA